MIFKYYIIWSDRKDCLIENENDQNSVNPIWSSFLILEYENLIERYQSEIISISYLIHLLLYIVSSTYILPI